MASAVTAVGTDQRLRRARVPRAQHSTTGIRSRRTCTAMDIFLKVPFRMGLLGVHDPFRRAAARCRIVYIHHKFIVIDAKRIGQ
jgi:hypothetical protein